MDPIRGYLGPGIYLLMLSFYWLIQTAYVLNRNVARRDGKLRRWRFSCKSDSRTAGSSGSPASTVDSGLPIDRPTCPASVWCVRVQRWPIEATFRLALSFVAASSELAIGALHGTLTDPFGDLGDLVRCTIYGLLGLSGLTDLLSHFRLIQPPGAGHFLMGVAFSGLAWSYLESGDQESLCAAVTTFILVVFLLHELWCDRTSASRVPRIFISLVTGSWLVQVGILRLVNFGGDLTPDVSTRKATWTGLFLLWHASGAAVVMLSVSMTVKCAKSLHRKTYLRHAQWISCCLCPSVEDDVFRASPSDDPEEMEPLALHP